MRNVLNEVGGQTRKQETTYNRPVWALLSGSGYFGSGRKPPPGLLTWSPHLVSSPGLLTSSPGITTIQLD